MRQKIMLMNQVFYPDGAATAQHTTDLAVFLQEKGYDVTVLTARRGYNKPDTIYAAREEYRGVKIIRIGSTGFGNRNIFTRFLDGVTFEIGLLARLLVTPRQDVVIAFTSPPLIGFIGAIFCLIKGGRLVNWLMDINLDAAIAVGYLREKSVVAKVLNSLFEFSLRRSAKIVVLDRWMSRKVEAHGIDGKKVAIVPPWPVHQHPAGDRYKKTNPFREAHHLEGKFVIMYSGNHSIVHPLETLLGAAVELREDPDVKFVFIGGGHRVLDVKATVEKHNLKNVLQLPHQPREMLEASLSLANLHVVVMGEAVSGLVHTSKVYGILATGAPYVAIAPRQSHLVDLLQECPYGYHVEHGDVRGLIEVIRRVQNLSAKELSEIDRHNRAKVNDHYTADISLEKFAEGVLERKGASAQNSPILAGLSES